MNFSDATSTDSAAMNVSASLSNISNPEDVQKLVTAAFQVIAQLILTGIITASIFIIAFVISFPFQAVLLKYRVNYLPSRQTEGEGTMDENPTQTGSEPAVKSYSSMFNKVLKFESWGGLYKGFVPSCIKQALIGCIVFLVLLSKGGNIEQPTQSVQGQLANKLFRMAFSLPFSIIINRAITTPYKLPWFNPAHSFRVLLSEAERRRPWLLYLTPGLFLAEFLYEVYSIILARPLTSAVNGNKEDPSSLFSRWPLARFCALLTNEIVQTAVQCLFDVVFARLSVQCSQRTAESVSEEKTEPEKNIPILHSDSRPYTGLVDCIRRIVFEEGYGALFRGWGYVFVVNCWMLPLVLVKMISGREKLLFIQIP
ncbi:hypothetical protein ACEPAF_1616 [Sanghuangporus sanghuang]